MRNGIRKFGFLSASFFALCSLFALGACDTEKDSSESADSVQGEVSSSSMESDILSEDMTTSAQETVSSSNMESEISSEETAKTLYYEATLEFYVNPIKTEDESNSDSPYVYGTYGIHVMDNIVKLLNADIFAEQLLTYFYDGSMGEDQEKYSVLMGQIQSALHYSYETYSVEDGGVFAKSFIYANISVSEDIGRTFAEQLRTAVIEKTPIFVEENMPILHGYVGTNCQRTSRLDELTEITK